MTLDFCGLNIDKYAKIYKSITVPFLNLILMISISLYELEMSQITEIWLAYFTCFGSVVVINRDKYTKVRIIREKYLKAEKYFKPGIYILLYV